ncbi:MAG: MATE family efflux transporter [Lachnospiraceae bacterium]|nr:MATE family efflux transporter [Lachnospiraceae bacterium]
MVKDLTVGTPSKTLWMYTVPLVLSTIFQQLYTMADSMIAGKYAGKAALAAVGASYPITMIFIALAAGTNIGCSVVISQLFGSKKMEGMKTAAYTSIVSTFALSVFMTVLGAFFCSGMIKMLNTPQDIFYESSLYLRIYIFGVVFLFMYNTCNGIFTALGDSKTPLYFLIMSSVFNVVLDLVFVIKFKWGVAGVAWATFIAQGVAGVMAFFVLINRLKKIETKGKVSFFSIGMLKRISVMAVPSACQKSFVSVGNLMIQTLVNSFGSDVIAGFSAGMRINTFVVTNIITLGNGLSGYVAQNYGACKVDRVKEGVKAGYIMMSVFALVSTLILMLFPGQLMGLFVDPTEGLAVIDVGAKFLRVVAPFFVVACLKICCDSVLRGTSCAVPFMVTTFADLILRVGLSFILVDSFGEMGIWYSWPIGWAIGAVLSFIFYKSGIWNKAKTE